MKGNQMQKRAGFSVVLGIVLVILGAQICEANIHISVDSTSIPLGMAATGKIEIQSINEAVVLGRGVGILRGGLSWKILKPDGSVIVISNHTSMVSVSGAYSYEAVIEPGASLNIPFCLLAWNGGLIFDAEGSYNLVATVFVNDQSPPLVHEVPVLVTKGGDGFQEWERTFVFMGEVVSPFELGFYNYQSLLGKEFAQTEVYGPCLDQLFVYNIGGFNLPRFLKGDSIGKLRENTQVADLTKDIEMGLFLAQKTGYGIDFWIYISERFNTHFPGIKKFQAENRDCGTWKIM